MRRRRNFRKSAFGHAYFGGLSGALGCLLARMERSNVPPNITPLQLIDLCAPIGDREVLVKAVEMASIGKYWRETSASFYLAEGVEVLFSIANCGENAPLLPRQPKLQCDANPQLIEDILVWARRRIEIGWDFGRLERALSALDDVCKSPAQVRYVWPSIMALCRIANLTELQVKLEEGCVPSSLPSLPGPLRLALQAGAGTVAMSCLIEDEPTGDRVSRKQKYVSLSVVLSGRRNDGFGEYGLK